VWSGKPSAPWMCGTEGGLPMTLRGAGNDFSRWSYRTLCTFCGYACFLDFFLAMLWYVCPIRFCVYLWLSDP
jgi:hypothetical protein